MDELKPCPFCRSYKVNVIEHAFHNLSSTYGVECWRCKAKSWQFFDTKEEAIEAWNRRASEIAELIEMLRTQTKVFLPESITLSFLEDISKSLTVIADALERRTDE